MDQTQTATTSPLDTFVLTASEPVQVSSLAQARNPIVPLAPERQSAVDTAVTTTVDDFVARVSAADRESVHILGATFIGTLKRRGSASLAGSNRRTIGNLQIVSTEC
ncbi:hypothetical protein [Cupriavidus basilensis]|uniref:hypothetical protein n=1 Tax=Cupriavidus basilensis TaxID=68895 RepID=UPI0039F69732